MKLSKLIFVLFVTCLATLSFASSLNLISHAGVKPLNLGDNFSWESTGSASPVIVSNTAKLPIAVTVSVDSSSLSSAVIYCNNSNTYIQPGSAFVCVTVGGVQWYSSSSFNKSTGQFEVISAPTTN